jgi:hypothetical protein
MNWFWHYVRRRLAELDRAAAEAAERPDVVVRQVCCIANVPHLADAFIAHNVTAAAVAHVLAEAVRCDPDSGRVAALRGVEFLAAKESAATWGAQDRRWLREMERAFAGR